MFTLNTRLAVPARQNNMETMMREYIKAAERHIEARRLNSFDYEQGDCSVFETLLEEKTHRGLMDYVEARHCSIGSAVLMGVLDHTSQNYIRGIRKGFREIYKQYKMEKF
jgi:hypothetical protein